MSKEKAKNQKKEFSADEKLQYAVFQNGNLSRDQIKEWYKKDVAGIYVLIAEVLRSEEALDALVEVAWKRYQKYHAEKTAQPELPLNQ